MYTVYKHTTPSGKIYIGVTSNKPTDRWKSGYGYMHNRYFFNAIKKYGWNNIRHEILFVDLTAEEAYSKEVELIKEYKSNDLNFGYNLSPGGESSRAGCKWGEEERNHHMEAIKKANRKHTDEEKEKIRASVLRYYEKIGKKRTEKTVKKGTKKRNRKIICVENGMVFFGAQAAADWANVKNRHLIYSAINKYGKHKMAGGYHWRFLNED